MVAERNLTELRIKQNIPYFFLQKQKIYNNLQPHIFDKKLKFKSQGM